MVQVKPSPMLFSLSLSFFFFFKSNSGQKKLSSKEQMSSALVLCGGFILFY